MVGYLSYPNNTWLRMSKSMCMYYHSSFISQVYIHLKSMLLRKLNACDRKYYMYLPFLIFDNHIRTNEGWCFLTSFQIWISSFSYITHVYWNKTKKIPMEYIYISTTYKTKYCLLKINHVLIWNNSVFLLLFPYRKRLVYAVSLASSYFGCKPS